MSKKILILGAGLMQKPAILAAKELGYTAVVVDANENAVCVPLADRFEPIDLKDRKALAAFADTLTAESKPEEGLAAVFTAGTDFSASVAYVAEHCGLAGHSFEACLNASDKLRMRACFKEAHVPSPDFVEVTGAQVAKFAHKAERGSLSFPKVVKPCDNMGGRGCRLIRHKDEFSRAVEEAVRNSRSNRAILEDYMDGAEFSIDAIVCNGELTITGFADRHIYFPPYFIEMGHTMPSNVPARIRHELISTFALGIHALGLHHGVAKADIKYTKDGSMIGEIAARLSGGYMSGWTYPYASDVALTKCALQVALGEMPAELLERRVPVPFLPPESAAGAEPPFALFEVPCKRVCAERAWLSIPGVVSSVIGLKSASRIEGVRDVLPRVGEENTVTFPHNNVEKGGNVIAVCDTRAQAEDAAYKAIRGITLRLQAHNSATDAFLSGVGEEGEDGFPPPAFADALAAYKEAPLSVDTLLLAGDKLSDAVPPVIAPFVETCTDWNHLSLQQAIARFDKLCPEHGDVNADSLWRALLQGSIQGALYVADSV